MKLLKNILTIFILLTGLGPCSAQTFLKYFAFDSTYTTAYSVVNKGDYLYVCGALSDTSNPNAIKSYFAKFDMAGNVIWYHTYRPKQYSQMYINDQNALISCSDGGFAAAGYVVDTNGIDSICFTRFDADGNLLYHKIFAPDIANYQTVYGFRLIEMDSAFYVLGDIQVANGYVWPVLAKIDFSGNVQFIKTYQTLPLMYCVSAASICPAGNNQLLIDIGQTNGNIYYWETEYSTCFMLFDTAGVLLRQHCTSDSDALYYQQVGATYDGNYLSCGSYYQLRGRDQPTEMDINYLVKLDNNFDTIWQLKAGPAEGDNTFTDFKQDANNNIYLCGSDYAPPSGHGAPKGSITKVSADGAV